MKRVVVERKILQRNDEAADIIRKRLAEKGIFALNFMSSPGAGKTSVIEKTINALKNSFRISFIDGDLETDRDAERIRKLGVDVVQINTSGACHLDANMVLKALDKLSLECDLLIIENVGNLVCPASFDVGADKNIVILSVPEGDDKVKKYPVMFNVADVVLINKTDLYGLLEFDREKVISEIREIKPDAEIFEVSCKTSAGFDAWLEYLRGIVPKEIL